MFFPGPSIICTRIYSGDIRPANEPSELGARLGLLGVNRDRAPIFRSRPNRAESEKTYDFRDRAETSNQLSEPRPSSGNSFSACLSSARKSRKSVCITQSARSIVIGNHNEYYKSPTLRQNQRSINSSAILNLVDLRNDAHAHSTIGHATQAIVCEVRIHDKLCRLALWQVLSLLLSLSWSYGR